jgi:2-dehydro-3-deoxygluconokinase
MEAQLPDPEHNYDITQDDLTGFAGGGPAFVALGETMIRDTPVDMQRPEATRQVYISLAGSELSVAVLLARFGIPSAYVTRVPDNPYGWMLRDVARGQGVNTDHIVWAPRTEPIARYIYEAGRTPRKSTGWYQRMFSAASRLAPGMVDWPSALRDCKLLHTSGITFGLAVHSGYQRNYLLETFHEALQARPPGCLVGLDFNYRSTLWTEEECTRVLTPLITEHVDVLITSVEDMVRHYGMQAPPARPRPYLRRTRGARPDTDTGDDGGDAGGDDALKHFLGEVIQRFDLKVVAITRRYPDTLEYHRWESAAMDCEGNFFRSPAPRPMVVVERLGGGDAWTGGFYYGLLTEGPNARGIRKGVLVGDAAARLKQTLMFDLPLIGKAEVQALLQAEGVRHSDEQRAGTDSVDR